MSLVISVTDYFRPWILWSLDIKFLGYLDPISFKPGKFLSPKFLATEYFVPGTFYLQHIGKNVIFCCCLATKNVQSNQAKLMSLCIRFYGTIVYSGNNTDHLYNNEPRHEKTGFLHMRKQRCRSASR